MRNGKISTAVALLLMNSVEAIPLTNKNQLNLNDDTSVADDSVNPDFVSSMTLVDWKNYTPEETLDMYQKSDYNVAKAQKAVDDNQTEIDDLNETLTNAQDQVDEVDKQIAKLQLKWNDYQAQQKAEILKAAEEDKLLKEGQDAIKKVEAQ
jgi:peptidoglycan hydrolase CwlO-like protein